MTKNILPPADTRSHQVETMVASSNSGGTWTIGNISVSVPEKFRDNKNFKKRMVLYSTYLKTQDPIIWDLYLNQRSKLSKVTLDWIVSKYDISGLNNELKEEFIQASKIYLSNVKAEIKILDEEALKKRNEKNREYQKQKREAIKAGTYVKKNEAKAQRKKETETNESNSKERSMSLEALKEKLNERKTKKAAERELQERKQLSQKISWDTGTNCKY